MDLPPCINKDKVAGWRFGSDMGRYFISIFNCIFPNHFSLGKGDESVYLRYSNGNNRYSKKDIQRRHK